MNITGIRYAVNNCRTSNSAMPNLRLVTADTVCFTSKNYKIPEDIDIEVIRNMSENTPGVIEVVGTGYLAQVFKYQSPKSGKIYAVKKLWPEHLKKHTTADPVKQLDDEIQAYKKLKNVKNIPKLYGYSNECDKKDANADHFIIVEWVEGKPVSKDSTFYDLEKIDKSRLKKIFDLIYEFDKRGVLQNDLWSANILFTDKDINIIDFNRSSFFNCSKNYEKSNLKDFKERFLWRYLSDIYHRSGEEKFFKIYKDTLKLEIDFLNRKSVSELFKHNNKGARELQIQAKSLKSLTDNQIKEKALKEIYESDLRCARIYSKYFEFNDNQAVESFKRARIIQEQHPNLLEDRKKLIDTNLEIISAIKNVFDKSENSTPEKSQKIFKNIEAKLNDKSVYTENERKETYYQKFQEFCRINMNIYKGIVH